jgi:protein phosphatase
VHPQRNILTRALGIDANVMVDSWEILPMVGDRYLLCSDGLFNEVDDNRLAATLRRLADPADAAKELVRLANEAGGRDNITCLVVDVIDDEGRDPAATATSSRITSHQGPGDPALDGLVGADPGDGTAAAAAPPSRRERRRAARAEHPRRRVLTWRLGLFVLAFLAIVGVTLGVIVYMGTNTYYVGVDDEQVAIFRGRPGGLLWIQPELAESTGIPFAEVPAASVAAVAAGVEQANLDDARRYVENLQEQIDRATTTTTTSTTTTTTTAVVPAAPVTPGSG